MRWKTFLKIAGVVVAVGITPYTANAENKDTQQKEVVQVKEITVKGVPALEFLADTVGNQDGVVQDTEENNMKAVLRQGTEFYILTEGPDDKFHTMTPFIYGNNGIFTSEKAFRDNYKETGIKAQAGILRFNVEGQITGAWSEWGYFARKPWQKEEAPKIDYAAKMQERRKTAK